MIDVDLTQALPATLVTLMGDFALTEAVMTDIAEAAWLKWRNLAARELHTSRQSYINGIQEPVARIGSRVITLVGWLPNAIESGLDSFELQRTLLENPNAKARHPIWSEAGRSGGRAQIGWYMNVPFRHGTPGTTGLAGQPMGSQYGPAGDSSRALSGGMEATAAGEFGKNIYMAVKAQKGRKVLKSGEVRPAQRLHESQAGPKLSAHHTTSIYTGMMKVRKPYKNVKTGKTTVQTQYVTFRRISTEGRKWIHPGIEPRNLAEKVNDYIREIAPRVVQNAINSAMRKG